MFRRQDQIKSYLEEIGNDQSSTMWNFRPTYIDFQYKFQPSQQLTDWNNQNVKGPPHMYVSSSDLHKQQTSMNNSFTSFNKIDRKKLQVKEFFSPICIQFTEKKVRNKLKKPQLFYHKMFQQQQKKSTENMPKIRNLLEQLDESKRFKPKSLPKTERFSGVFRMLKKRQSVRINKKKNLSPENIKGNRYLC